MDFIRDDYNTHKLNESDFDALISRQESVQKGRENNETGRGLRGTAVRPPDLRRAGRRRRVALPLRLPPAGSGAERHDAR